MAKLRLVAPDGRTLELAEGRGVLGRDKDCDLQLDDRSISRRHVVLEERDGRWHFVDQGSVNGTRLDGQRLAEGPLAHGQELKVGTVALRVELEDDEATVLLAPAADVDATAVIALPSAPAPAAERRPAPPPLPKAAAPAAPAPGDPRAAAAARLGVAASASSYEVKARYDELSADLEARIRGAQTPHLQRTWQKNLDELREAVRVLAPDVLLDYTVSDLPSAQPVVAADAIDSPPSVIRPASPAASHPPARPPAARGGAGRTTLVTLLAGTSMVLIAAAVFFSLSTSKTEEEIAKRLSDASYLEARETVTRLAPVETLLRSGALRNGKLKLCNRASVPVEVAWLGAVYLRPTALPEGSDAELAAKASGFEVAGFNSAFCAREFDLTLQPGEERELQLQSSEPRCAWDGSALFWSLAAQRAGAPAASPPEAAAAPAAETDKGTVWKSGLVDPAGGCVDLRGDW